jgi:hypothetical protein
MGFLFYKIEVEPGYRRHFSDQATGLSAEESCFDSRQDKETFFFFQSAQTLPGAQEASCSKGSGHYFHWVKEVRAVKLITHLHLILRLRMSGAMSQFSHVI